MKRLAFVEYEDASPEVQAVYDEIMEVRGRSDIFNVLKAFGHNEKVVRGLWSMIRYTMLEGEIPSLLKQLILFRISVEYENKYCTSLHGQTVFSLHRSITYNDLLNLDSNENINMPPAYSVAINIVTQMALQPKTVEGDDFNFEEQLRDEGFSEQEIDELIALAGCGVLLNTLTDVVHAIPENPLTPSA